MPLPRPVPLPSVIGREGRYCTLRYGVGRDGALIKLPDGLLALLPAQEARHHGLVATLQLAGIDDRLCNGDWVGNGGLTIEYYSRPDTRVPHRQLHGPVIALLIGLARQIHGVLEVTED